MCWKIIKVKFNHRGTKAMRIKRNLINLASVVRRWNFYDWVNLKKVVGDVKCTRFFFLSSELKICNQSKARKKVDSS